MAEYLIETTKGDKVRVKLDKPPTGDALKSALLAEYQAGRFQLVSPPPSVAQEVVNVFRPAVTAAVSGAIRGLASMGGAEMPPRPDMGSADMIADALVPRTPIEIGVMVGTGGAGLMTSGARMGTAALARVGGGTIGGAAGGVLMGDPVGGALQGAGTTAVGEFIGAGLGKLFRSSSVGRTMAAASEADEVAQMIGRYVPGLAEVTDPSSLLRAGLSKGAGSYHRALSDRLKDKTKTIHGLVGGKPLNVPSLSPPSSVAIPAGPQLYNAAGQSIQTPASTATVNHPVSVQEASDLLKQIGYAGFGGSKDTHRTIVGLPSRQQWQDSLNEIRQELIKRNPTGEALKLFDESRREWAIGTALLDLLGTKGSVKGYPNYVEINMNGLRTAFESPKMYRRLEARMTTEDFSQLQNVLYRGGPFGSRDLLPSGAPGMSGPAMQMMRQGGGTGTAAVLLPKTLLPEFGAQRTGQAPLQLPAAGQTLLDLGAQGALRDVDLRIIGQR